MRYLTRVLLEEAALAFAREAAAQAASSRKRKAETEEELRRSIRMRRRRTWRWSHAVVESRAPCWTLTSMLASCNSRWRWQLSARMRA